MRLTVLPTADLGRDGLRALRALLDAAFPADADGAGGFDDASFDHALGGVHVLAGPLHDPVGHAAVVGRRLLHDGVALRTGYVEAVAVRPGSQGGGLGGLLMAEVDRIVRGGYRLGALGAAARAARLYRRHGWEPWCGPLAALTPDGVVDTPDERGTVHVLPVDAPLDPARALVCDWRDGELW
ncbi:GNAT family N-acetyltransferase [Pseudonocardia sp. McavD-2-B]|uniref:GNAT family N-acetyltransferase n=1 Tax=Pseudonocardia sp. McavD-2-B TaxID=2954499 RepID=UPI0020972B13|nr:GNAT family N-acetyltransferase [Pseudonocardia sp. McavD-2-B]MCO7196166.1 GNAT family N-acetyltransferase [Pseudonocardia sp. McavD-2-B]